MKLKNKINDLEKENEIKDKEKDALKQKELEFKQKEEEMEINLKKYQFLKTAFEIHIKDLKKKNFLFVFAKFMLFNIIK